MKHFWLTPEGQEVMDTATDTAGDYGYVGLFSVDKAWKRHVQGMVGSKVDPKDYLRAFNIAGSTRFYSEDWGVERTVRALIRLNSDQAMVMKLRHAGSDEAWVHCDPTGEAWGNLLVARRSRITREGIYGWASRRLVNNLVIAGSAGPTVANVGAAVEGLPDDIRTSFVEQYWDQWHRFDEPYGTGGRGVDGRLPIRHPFWRDDNSPRWAPYGPWQTEPKTAGQLWAQDFWMKQVVSRIVMMAKAAYKVDGDDPLGLFA